MTFDVPNFAIEDPEAAADKVFAILNSFRMFAEGATEYPTGPLSASPGPMSAGVSQPGVAATATTNVAPAVPEGTFVQPGSPDVMGVNSPYGVDRGGGTTHPGIDLAFPDKTTVLAATSGTVTQAGGVAPGQYGLVEITAPNGLVTRYGHVSGLNVQVGDTVKAGQQIAISGGLEGEPGQGNARGAHLHFEVLVNGQNVDPAPYLAGGVSIAGDPGGTPLTPQAVAKAANPQDVVGQQVVSSAELLAGRPPQAAAPAVEQTTESQIEAGTTASDGDPAGIDAFLAATRQHESGGNYQIYNQSGLSDASGAYQFLSTTWKSYGGSTATAAQASPAEQDAVARRMASELFQRFGSWRLVAIAWYGGPGVAEQVVRGENPGSPSGQGPYLAYGDKIVQMMSGGG